MEKSSKRDNRKHFVQNHPEYKESFREMPVNVNKKTASIKVLEAVNKARDEIGYGATIGFAYIARNLKRDYRRYKSFEEHEVVNIGFIGETSRSQFIFKVGNSANKFLLSKGFTMQGNKGVNYDKQKWCRIDIAKMAT